MGGGVRLAEPVAVLCSWRARPRRLRLRRAPASSRRLHLAGFVEDHFAEALEALHPLHDDAVCVGEPDAGHESGEPYLSGEGGDEGELFLLLAGGDLVAVQVGSEAALS
jgi:hypothetical protein